MGKGSKNMNGAISTEWDQETAEGTRHLEGPEAEMPVESAFETVGRQVDGDTYTIASAVGTSGRVGQGMDARQYQSTRTH